MDLGLNDTVAIVGGASSGMGRAVARTLATEGCRVVLDARRADLLAEAVAAITAETGTEALAVPADATDPAALDRVCDLALERFGRPDIVVNNAGGPPAGNWAKTISRDEARHGITVNSIAPGHVGTERLVQPYSSEADAAAAMARDAETIPAGRFGTPDEIAAAVAFLCSNGAAYITGTTMLVDGGLARGLLS